MYSTALLMMPSLPAFLSLDPVCGRWRFSLSRASLMRLWRRRSRAFLLRADSSDRLWCGTYFLRRFGFCTPIGPAIAWCELIKDADVYPIFVMYGCGRAVYQMRGQVDMCSMPLSRLINPIPDNGSFHYSSFDREIEPSKALIDHAHSGNRVSVLSVTQYPLCCWRSHLDGDSAGCDHQHPTVRTAGRVLLLKLDFKNVLIVTSSYFTVDNIVICLYNRVKFRIVLLPINSYSVGDYFFTFLYINCMGYFYEPEFIFVVPVLDTS